jgi:hypothetical protein
MRHFLIYRSLLLIFLFSMAAGTGYSCKSKKHGCPQSFDKKSGQMVIKPNKKTKSNLMPKKMRKSLPSR